MNVGTKVRILQDEKITGTIVELLNNDERGFDCVVQYSPETVEMLSEFIPDIEEDRYLYRFKELSINE